MRQVNSISEIKTESFQQQTPGRFLSNWIMLPILLKRDTNLCLKQTSRVLYWNGDRKGRTTTRYNVVSLLFIPFKWAYNSYKLGGGGSLCILELWSRWLIISGKFVIYSTSQLTEAFCSTWQLWQTPVFHLSKHPFKKTELAENLHGRRLCIKYNLWSLPSIN